MCKLWFAMVKQNRFYLVFKGPVMKFRTFRSMRLFYRLIINISIKFKIFFF